MVNFFQIFFPDPAESASGFMSEEEIRLLVEISRGRRSGLSNHQYIFPDIRFDCSGEIVKWIVGGYAWNGPYSPHLQIWSPVSSGHYTRKNTSALSSARMRGPNVYEQDVHPPLPFEPGDVLGVFHPWYSESNIQLHIDTNQASLFYGYSTYNERYTSPQHVQFRTNNATIRTGALLVSVELCELYISSPFMC